jgi:predicted phage terminase large subunit-like protein
MNTQLDEATIKQLAQKGKDSFFFFTRAILGFNKLTPEIHKPICDMLQDYDKNTRLTLILPRGWYKSTIATISYPLWRAVVNPEVRILLVQNTYTNACGKLGAIKQIVESCDLFKLLYPEVLPNNDCTWSKDMATVNRKGAYPEGTWEAAGTGTQKTGQHYDLIIEDDTVSPDKDNLTGAMMQPTQGEIEKAIGWHKLGDPLLIEPLESQRIVIGTRWAENDLLGYIIDHAPEYKVLTRAVRETDGKPNPDGAIQWPARFNDLVLSSLARSLGPHMYSALYMNFPTSAANQVFSRDWINYYANLPQDGIYCTSVDPASALAEESSDPDYTVVCTTCLNPHNGHIYVVHYTRERMNPSTTISTIFDHYRAYKPVKVIIEGIGYQRTIKHFLELKQRKLGIYFAIDLITGHKASKLDRVRGLQPFFAANRIFIKASMTDLERELLAFPKGAHDDIVDAMAMQLDFWNIATTLTRSENDERLTKNPHSADAILAELQSRPNMHSRYPYDIGHNNKRLPDWMKRRQYVKA